MYKILNMEGRAKRATFETVHGTIQTPVFMNVGTVGAIKGHAFHVSQSAYLLRHVPQYSVGMKWMVSA